MKFAMAYSCGKDSTLALHKMLAAGHEAVCLLVVYNAAAEKSYFHGADMALLRQYEEALGIPLIVCPVSGDSADIGGAYAAAFEDGLREAGARGAEAGCFGDIDIEENRRWEEERCRACGLGAVFPLWQRGREENVAELLAAGFKCLIKSVNTRLLPAELAGRFLDEKALEIMRGAGVDICGENGEYHTLAADGPIFRRPLALNIGGRGQSGDHTYIELG